MNIDESIKFLNDKMWNDAEWDCEAVRNAVKVLEISKRIVHCKDCKHWGGEIHCMAETEYVKPCMLATYLIGENGFCTYGESRL